jgi:hypothetical protein
VRPRPDQRQRGFRFFQSVVRRCPALPGMRGRIRVRACAKKRRRHDDPNCRQKQNRCGRKKERTVMGYGLAERTVYRVAVARRLIMRSSQDPGDSGWRRRVNVGLGDVGLQCERKQQQAGDDAPTPTSCLAQRRTCLHSPRTLPACESRPTQARPARRVRHAVEFLRITPSGVPRTLLALKSSKTKLYPNRS